MPRVKAIARKLTVTDSSSCQVPIMEDGFDDDIVGQESEASQQPLSLIKQRETVEQRDGLIIPNGEKSFLYDEPLNLCVRETFKAKTSDKSPPINIFTNSTEGNTLLSTFPYATTLNLTSSSNEVDKRNKRPHDFPMTPLNEVEESKFVKDKSSSSFGNKRVLYSHEMVSTSPCDTPPTPQKTVPSMKHNNNNNHNQQEKRPCPLCGKLLRPGSMREHLDRHTGQGRFPCKQCDKTFSRSSALEKHILTHTGDKPFACPHCEKRYRQKVHLNEHMRSHTGERPFSCSQCHLRLASKSLLNRHMRTHREVEDEDERGSQISLTSDTAVNPNDALNQSKEVHKTSTQNEESNTNKIEHLNLETTINTFHSVPLSLSSGNLAAVAAAKSIVEALQVLNAAGAASHIIHTSVVDTIPTLGFHQKREADTTSLLPLPLTFPCVRCKCEFPTIKALQCHEMTVHESDKPLSISLSQELSNGNTLVLPSSILQSDPPASMNGSDSHLASDTTFDCRECSRTYKSLKLLRDHQKTQHDKPQVYKCDVCGRVFREKRYLRNHREVHAEQKRFCCHLCGGTFTRKASLNTHVLRLHGQMPLQESSNASISPRGISPEGPAQDEISVA